MKYFVSMRKLGKFYNSFEDDAYVLHSITGYKIKNGRLGFPVIAIGKVQTLLEDKKISYKIINSDEDVEIKDFKKLNRYKEELAYGKNNINILKSEVDLKEKIKTLPKEKVDDIFNYIEGILNEQR